MPGDHDRERSPRRSPNGRDRGFTVINVGILGLGTVGSGTAETLIKQRQMIRERMGIDLVLKRAADLRVDTLDIGFDIPKEVLTKDANEVINDPDIKIVVELIGGKGVAKKFIVDALKAGKSVVTANKALLADCGVELFDVAAANNVDLFYEAAVAGGIPLIKALREGLVANPIQCILGILNGTCNYILTRMEREGVAFDVVLKDAQELGYAETPPDLDIDGWDTAHKALILAQLAFGGSFTQDQVFVKGIRNLDIQDINYAAEFGYRIKLLAILKGPQDGGEVEISVEPTLIPAEHLLSKVNMSFNAAFVKGEVVDETMYYGRGAGRLPTASAVAGDVVDVARNHLMEGEDCRSARQDRNPLRLRHHAVPVKPVGERKSKAYIRLEVRDVAGSLAKVATALAAHNVSILALTDFLRGRPLPGASLPKDALAPVVLLTGEAKNSELDKALEALLKLPEVGPSYARFRVESLAVEG